MTVAARRDSIGAMAALLTALILIVVMGGLLAIPIMARARPHSRLAQAIRGAGERYNDLYLAGHDADDEAPERAVATGPLDDDRDDGDNARR